MKKLNKNLKAELDSWICKDENIRKRKSEREFARYPRMIKEMGLDLIDTSDKMILEIGCGPKGLISILDAELKMGLDPLASEYQKYYKDPFNNMIYIDGYGEEMPFGESEGSLGFDLIVIPNSLDHCQEPNKVIEECKRVMSPSGWLAVHNCINLAKCHPHESHINNISYNQFRNLVDKDFECYHTLQYPEIRYGWIKGPDGKVGQPCFTYLGRICSKGA